MAQVTPSTAELAQSALVGALLAELLADGDGHRTDLRVEPAERCLRMRCRVVVLADGSTGVLAS